MDYQRERDRSRPDKDRPQSAPSEPHVPDHLLGGRWRRGYRHGFVRWGVGWGLQNFGCGPQGYGWGGGWTGGHGEMYNPGHFGGGYAGSPELVEHYAVPGRYAGVGPKGYTRSDDRIREDVSEQLWADPWIDASEVSVAVINGEVTLEGTVNDRASKRLAEDIPRPARA